MVLLSSKNFKADFTAIDFQLPGINDRVYSLDYFKHYNFLMIVFMCVHCPYVQAIESELIYIKDKYIGAGLEIVAINPNDADQHSEDSLDGMKKRASQMRYNFIYLHDFDQDVARAYDAVCTPDIYLFDKDRKLVYRGRLKEVPEVIENLKAGIQFNKQMIPSQGCSIKWKV
jgi:thiol-disulfide isomerase/thioredoxin